MLEVLLRRLNTVLLAFGPIPFGLAAEPTHPVEIAYVARFYTRSPSKLRSRFRLYVSDIRGAGRREIPVVGTPLRVKWVNRTRLFVERENRSPVLVDMTTLKISQPDQKGTEPALNRSLLEEGQQLGNWFVTLDQERGNLVMKSDKGEVKFLTLPTSWRRDEAGIAARLWGSQPTRRLFVGLESSNSTQGTVAQVIRWEISQNRFIPVLKGMNSYDFDPRRKFWSAVEARAIDDLDRKRGIWVGSVVAGDLTTGKSWRVTPEGLVWAISSAVRPTQSPSSSLNRTPARP